jgi:hypothetical protein
MRSEKGHRRVTISRLTGARGVPSPGSRELRRTPTHIDIAERTAWSSASAWPSRDHKQAPGALGAKPDSAPIFRFARQQRSGARGAGVRLPIQGGSDRSLQAAVDPSSSKGSRRPRQGQGAQPTQDVRQPRRLNARRPAAAAPPSGPECGSAAPPRAGRGDQPTRRRRPPPAREALDDGDDALATVALRAVRGAAGGSARSGRVGARRASRSGPPSRAWTPRSTTTTKSWI